MADTSRSTCIVRAQDFSQYTTDQWRDQWTITKLSFVLAVLADQPVIITTDRSTGHALVGVRLVGLIERPGHGGASDHRVVVEETYAPGQSQRVNYSIRDLGDTIVPLGDWSGHKGVKWSALDVQREHERAAGDAVRAWMAEHERAAGVTATDHTRAHDDRSWYGRTEVSSASGRYGRTAYVTWQGQRECDRDGNGALPRGGRIDQSSSAGWHTFTVDTATGKVTPHVGYGSPLDPRPDYARR